MLCLCSECCKLAVSELLHITSKAFSALLMEVSQPTLLFEEFGLEEALRDFEGYQQQFLQVNSAM